MTIVEERELTQVQPPLVEPIPEELERPAPRRLEPEKKARPQVVRWLAWIAGVVIIGLAVAAISWMIDGDEAVETTLSSAVITEARIDSMYDGPAQLPGGVLPENLMPAYNNPAQLPGGVLAENLVATDLEAVELPGGIYYLETLVTEQVEAPLTGYP